MTDIQFHQFMLLWSLSEKMPARLYGCGTSNNSNRTFITLCLKRLTKDMAAIVAIHSLQRFLRDLAQTVVPERQSHSDHLG